MRKLVPIINSILSRFIFAIVISILLLTVFVTLVRVAAPVIIKKYQSNFVMLAENYLHLPVKVGKITGTMYGFTPVINFKNVTVMNKEKSKVLFNLNDLQIGFDAIKSLLKEKIIMNSLFIKGIGINIYQNKDKQWEVKGIASDKRQSNTATQTLNDSLGWLLEQKKVMLEDIHLTVKPYSVKGINISALDLLLVNSGNHHNLRSMMSFSDKTSSLFMAAEADGPADSLEQLSGNFYIKDEGFPLNKLIPSYQYKNIRVKAEGLNAKIWGHWHNKSIDNVQAGLELNSLTLQNKSYKPVRLNNLTANVLFEKKPTEWLVSADKVNASYNNSDWKNDGFKFVCHRSLPSEPGCDKAVFKASYIKINDLVSSIIQMQLASKKALTIINKIHPTGRLNNVVVQHDSNLKTLESYSLDALFTDISFAKYHKIPGVSHVNGSISTDYDTGRIVVDANNAGVDMPHLFPHPFVHSRISGQVDWKKYNKQWAFQLTHLVMKNSDVSINANLNLMLPMDNHSPRISMLGSVAAKHLNNIDFYLPENIFPNKLSHWLNNAFVSGDSADGSFILHGPLKDFPFTHNTGRFLISTAVKNLQLHYGDSWPTVNKLSGQLVFSQDGMRFDLTSGNTAGQPINSLLATLNHMSDSTNINLIIKSNVAITNSSAVPKVLLASPLSKHFVKGGDGLKLSGTGRLLLNLKIRFKNFTVKAKGMLSLINNQLSLSAWNTTFNHINGDITFDNNGISAKTITAKFLGEPLLGSLKTFGSSASRKVQLQFLGNANISNVEKAYNINLGNVFQGDAGFSGVVNFSPNTLNINLTSDLQGVEINLPKPYHKPKSMKHNVFVSAELKNNIPLGVSLNYRNLLNGVFKFSETDSHAVISGGIVHFGPGEITKESPSGFSVEGIVPPFIWEQWQPYLLPLLTHIQSNHNGAKISVDNINIELDSISIYHNVFRNIKLWAFKQASAWDIKLTNDAIEGSITIPANEMAPVVGNFTKILLPKLETNYFPASLSAGPTLPFPLNLSVDDFSYAGKSYGTVNLDVKPISKGLKISKGLIVNSLYTLNLDGEWLREDNKDSSFFYGKLSSNDFGKLLSQMSVTNHIDNGSGSIDFSLSWPYSPIKFYNKDIEGTIKINVSDGAIVQLSDELNSKLGLGKIINLLSLDNLSRAVTSGFNTADDEQGYKFDSLKGDLIIDHGVVKTSNSIFDGPVAKIYFHGMIDIKKELYGLAVSVNPYLTSSLPVIATIAGGPIAGVATWLLSKIARPGIEKAVVYKYYIGGTWKDPIVKHDAD